MQAQFFSSRKNTGLHLSDISLIKLYSLPLSRNYSNATQVLLSTYRPLNLSETLACSLLAGSIASAGRPSLNMRSTCHRTSVQHLFGTVYLRRITFHKPSIRLSFKLEIPTHYFEAFVNSFQCKRFCTYSTYIDSGRAALASQRPLCRPPPESCHCSPEFCRNTNALFFIYTLLYTFYLFHLFPIDLIILSLERLHIFFVC